MTTTRHDVKFYNWLGDEKETVRGLTYAQFYALTQALERIGIVYTFKTFEQYD